MVCTKRFSPREVNPLEPYKKSVAVYRNGKQYKNIKGFEASIRREFEIEIDETMNLDLFSKCKD